MSLKSSILILIDGSKWYRLSSSCGMVTGQLIPSRLRSMEGDIVVGAQAISYLIVHMEQRALSSDSIDVLC